MAQRILIVEDDIELAAFMGDFLRERSFEVLTAANGLEAIEASHNHHIDLILMDIRLPFFSGVWFCKAFKEKPETCNIPVVFVSGLPEEEVKLQALSAGGCAFLKKPFSLGQLLETVQTHATRH